MRLDHRFTVPLGPDDAWRLLTDLERIAPCMPGAQLQEVAGDEYLGLVKVKVGPIATSYKGAAKFVERDGDARRAVIKASGRDARGQGNATATITMALASGADGTDVSVSTDLAITGRVAQLGRGAISDVSEKLLGQFVGALSDLAAASPTEREGGDRVSGAGALGNGREGTPDRRVVHHAEPEAVELLSTAGPAVAKRLLPALVAFLVLWVIVRRARG